MAKYPSLLPVFEIIKPGPSALIGAICEAAGVCEYQGEPYLYLYVDPSHQPPPPGDMARIIRDHYGILEVFGHRPDDGLRPLTPAAVAMLELIK